MDMGEVKAECVRFQSKQYFSLFFSSFLLLLLLFFDGRDLILLFFYFILLLLLSFMLRALTMVTSSIFDILRTNMLTRTTAGPSGG